MHERSKAIAIGSTSVSAESTRAALRDAPASDWLTSSLCTLSLVCMLASVALQGAQASARVSDGAVAATASWHQAYDRVDPTYNQPGAPKVLYA